jgi:glucosamine-6-phosphate deaminase
VPERAISISVRQLLKARTIVCCVPEARKADALKRCLEGSVSPLAPASILRTHPDATLHVDPDSSARLSPEILQRGEIAIVRDEGGPLRNKARHDD